MRDWSFKQREREREREMGILTASLVLPSEIKPSSLSLKLQQSSIIICRRPPNIHKPFIPVARLFGPAIFESSKLKVFFLGVDEKKHPGKLPRTYTLTHCDVTSKLTLTISQTINNSQLQGWYNKLQRDEVIAEWKKVRETMSLHVHCHISGGHFLLDLCAGLRYFIFSKELPVVIKAFVHGDRSLLNHFPELQDSMVWVYFHSNTPEFNRVQCWGPLKNASALPSSGSHQEEAPSSNWDLPKPCQENCRCCFPTRSLIPWSQDLAGHNHQQKTKDGLMGLYD